VVSEASEAESKHPNNASVAMLQQGIATMLSGANVLR
jgi:hypothetical protein